MLWALVLCVAIAGVMGLAACQSGEDLSGSAIGTKPTQPSVPTVLPPPTDPNAGLDLPTEEPTTEPGPGGELPTETALPPDVTPDTGAGTGAGTGTGTGAGTGAVDPAVQAVLDKLALLNPDLGVRIGDLIAQSGSSTVTLPQIEQLIADDGSCPECGDELKSIEIVLTGAAAAGLIDVIKDARIRGAMQELAASRAVASVDAATVLAELQSILTGVDVTGVLPGDRTGQQPGNTGQTGPADPMIAELVALAALLDTKADSQIAVIVKGSPTKVLPYPMLRDLVAEKCPTCLPELERIFEATQKLVAASAVAPITDAAARSTAQELAAGNPVSTAELARWIERLKKRLEGLE